MLSFLVRYLITWPVLIVVAINIENAANFLGAADEITENWERLTSWAIWLRDIATTPWVLNITLVIFGMVVYEWASWASRKLDQRSPKYYLFTTKNNARVMASAFLKDGFYRRRMPIAQMIEDLNERLAYLGLPLLPDDIGSDEEVNRAFGRYLHLVADGDFDSAKDMLNSVADRMVRDEPKLISPPHSASD